MQLTRGFHLPGYKCGDHFLYQFPRQVRSDADHTIPAYREHGQGDGVVTAVNQEIIGCLSLDLRHLIQAAAGLFNSRDVLYLR